MQTREKGRKRAKHCVFPMICGSGESKSTLAGAAGAEPVGRWEMKNCTPLWRDYTTLHDTTRHYTQHTTHYTMPHHTTLNYITLHYPTPHCVTLPYIALHYPTFTTPPQMQLQLHYTNYTTPQLQLHYTTTTTTAALHHTTSSSCGWGDRPGDHCNHCNHSKKTQLQSPVGPSVDLLCHPWFTETNLSYRFPILTLPPPPCAALLICIYIYNNNNFTILSLSIYLCIYICVYTWLLVYTYTIPKGFDLDSVNFLNNFKLTLAR